MIHLAVSIGHSRKIKTDLSQTIGGCIELLTVPEGFHDIKTALFVHRTCRTGQNAGYLLFREAVEELAHPDGVKSSGKRNSRIEQIGTVSVNTCRFGQFFGLLAHHFQLLRKVHDGHFYRRVITYASGCPASGIASYVQ